MLKKRIRIKNVIFLFKSYSLLSKYGSYLIQCCVPVPVINIYVDSLCHVIARSSSARLKELGPIFIKTQNAPIPTMKIRQTEY